MTENRPQTIASRAALDGRIAFVIAAAATAAALIVVVDRIGAPERFAAGLGAAALLCGLAALGLLRRTMRVGAFYYGGRSVPAVYAGLGVAALYAALLIPFAPPAAAWLVMDQLGAAAALGFAAAALVVGPLLRASGAFSPTDALAARFSHPAARRGWMAAAIVIGAATGVGALQTAIADLSLILGAPPAWAGALVAATLTLLVAPAGLSGVAWGAAAAGGLTIATFAAPLAVLAGQGRALAAPVFGASGAWEAGVSRLMAWSAAATPDVGALSFLALGGAALGIIALAPLLSPFVATVDAPRARRTGAGALLWAAVLSMLVLTALATTARFVGETTDGRRPDQWPPAIYWASAAGLATVCGARAPTPAAAHAACAAVGRAPADGRDLAPTPQFVSLALAPLAELGAGAAGLMASARIALSLALAAAAFFAMAAVPAWRARMAAADARTSRNLAVTRALYAAAIIVVAAFTVARGVDARAAFALAGALSAALVAPALILAHARRAGNAAALAALAAGAAALLWRLSQATTVTQIAESGAIGCAAALLAGALGALLAPAGRATSRRGDATA